jgi:hypothetical protein
MLVHNTAGVLMLMAAVDAPHAETGIPGETPEIRSMSIASVAEKFTRACSTTFQIKATAKAKHAKLVDLARSKYPAAYKELIATSSFNQADCVKAGVNFYCNVRSDEFLELTDQARTKLNEIVPGIKFDGSTVPKECKNRSPL